MFQRIKPIVSVGAGIPFALLYGAIARYFFGLGVQDPNNIFGVLTLAFILLVPIAIGALTIFFAPSAWRVSWPFAVFMPWASMFIAAIIAALIALEAAICVAMALPLMLVMASVGGFITFSVMGLNKQAVNLSSMGVLMLAPFLFAPFESAIPASDSFRTVHTQIEIAASPEVVWQNIIRVAPIKPEERSFSLLFDIFGAPKPLEAQLLDERTNAMRQGVFMGGLTFNERIIIWEPNRRLDFEITTNNQIPRATLVSLAPWSEIGGKYFAVPVASYRLEPSGNGKLILHLSSTHRLTTRFNAYGGWWTDWGMREFQNQILRIVKMRAERAETGN